MLNKLLSNAKSVMDLNTFWPSERFPTAIIQIIHHGWIQNHRQEKIQNDFLDPKKKNSEHHNYKDEQRKVQRDPIGAQFWKID